MKNKEQFYKDLFASEASGKWDSTEINHGNYYGGYQMGKLALTDVKYYNAKADKWTGRDGINNLDDFLKNKEVQQKAVEKYHQIIWDDYLKDYQKYEGQEIGGIKLDKSAMISCAHLVGHKAIKHFIDSKGEIDDADGNKIKCSQYLKKFAGYDVDFSTNPQSSSNPQQGSPQPIPNSQIDDKKAQEEAAAKQEQDRKAAEEVEKAKQQQTKTDEEAKKVEADKKIAEDGEKAKQEQDAQNKQAEVVNTAEADKKAQEDATKVETATSVSEPKQDIQIITKEVFDKMTPEEKQAIEDKYGEEAKKTLEAIGKQEEQAADEAQKLQVSLAEMGNKQIQEMKNFSKYDKLSREGVEVNPTMDSNELDRAESQHDQTEQLRKTQQEQTDNYAADFQHRITEPNKSIGLPSDNTSLSHYAIGTGSGIGKIGGVGDNNKPDSTPAYQGIIEFTPCSTNPDAYGNDTSVNLIGTDQSHTDAGI